MSMRSFVGGPSDSGRTESRRELFNRTFVYLKPRLGLTKATVRARSRSNGKLEGRYTVPLGPGIAACDLVRRVPALRLRLNSQKANFISRKMGGLAGPAPARREAVPLTGPVTISFQKKRSVQPANLCRIRPRSNFQKKKSSRSRFFQFGFKSSNQRFLRMM